MMLKRGGWLILSSHFHAIISISAEILSLMNLYSSESVNAVVRVPKVR